MSSFSFVACAGAITDDLIVGSQSFSLDGGTWRHPQIAQGSEAAYDLITVSIGGNNIGFADEINDCADNVLAGDSLFGCRPDLAEVMGRRIESVTGTQTGWILRDPPHVGRYDIPTTYDFLASIVAPGGHVVVMGYPQLVEEVDRWGLWHRLKDRCERIRSRDVPTLREVSESLDDSLRSAVLAADARHPEVTFTYISTIDLFENRNDPQDRHGLCAPGGEWLNGLTDVLGDYRKSYHPNRDGHVAMARHLLQILYTLDWGAPGVSLGDHPRDRRDAVLSAMAQRDVATLRALVADDSSFELLRDIAQNPQTEMFGSADRECEPSGSLAICEFGFALAGAAAGRLTIEWTGTEWAITDASVWWAMPDDEP